MRETEWVPSGIDTWTPNGARIYDYMLGGHDNYPADRAAADRMLQSNPAAPRTAMANRDFLGRVVSHLAGEVGITQFLDVGSGLPTQRNVHEVAQESNRDARIVYVDRDPTVIRHSQALLERHGVRNAIAFEGDLRSPGRILTHPNITGFLDFNRPVAVLLVAILHFVSDEEDAHGIVRRLASVLVPGSHLVISHTTDESPPDVMEAAQQGFRLAGSPLTPRSRAGISRFFTGFDLLEPGLVDVRDWRPALRTDQAWPSGWTIAGGVGARP
ncbi:SAM-dependent methyltransferase [Nonomuraea soli]|uniref:SAM-dependent methyltransferase n=1 Tax=Nonomuraea soli TaxID=1032476 RepID=A0A7W0CIW4_9ACTN|nr:SAM-dependent methyltransferase [Nonomuraea soli]MBA2891737.1 SAM-dependent methyltransferase [Nonomuraea soli]